jgi:hypothetical protein
MQRWQIADLRLIAARLYWKQGRFARSLLAAGHAFVTRPMMLGRPVKLLLRWLQLGTAREEVGAVQYGND